MDASTPPTKSTPRNTLRAFRHTCDVYLQQKVYEVTWKDLQALSEEFFRIAQEGEAEDIKRNKE